MSKWAYLAAGVVVGALAFAAYQAATDPCCKLVAQGIRDKVTGALGPFGDWIGRQGDSAGVWDNLTGAVT
jgi:hypothetical protein